MSISNLLVNNSYDIYCNKLDAETSGTVQENQVLPLGGAIVATNANVTYSKHGKIIYITFQTVSANYNAGNHITSTAPIPADYRPTYEIYEKIVVEENSVNAFGTIKIENNGNVTIYNGTEGNFTTSTIGYSGFCIKFVQS